MNGRVGHAFLPTYIQFQDVQILRCKVYRLLVGTQGWTINHGLPCVAYTRNRGVTLKMLLDLSQQYLNAVHVMASPHVTYTVTRPTNAISQSRHAT